MEFEFMNHSCEGGTIVHPNWLLLWLLHPECKWTLVYPFKSTLTEGEVYQIASFGEDENTGFFCTTRHEFRLNFQLRTTVKKVEGVPIPLYDVKLVSFGDILRNDFESPFSVDTMGLLIAIGTEKEYDKDGKKTRMMGGMFVVLATVKGVNNGLGWWCASCRCHGQVTPDSGLYYCAKCNSHIVDVVPRYRMKLRVIDQSDTATFVPNFEEVMLWDVKEYREGFNEPVQ